MDSPYLQTIDGTSPVPYEQVHWVIDENGYLKIWMKDDDDTPKNQETPRTP